MIGFGLIVLLIAFGFQCQQNPKLQPEVRKSRNAALKEIKVRRHRDERW